MTPEQKNELLIEALKYAITLLQDKPEVILLETVLEKVAK